ncbi:MAG: DUF6114 domain-containing protein [Methanoculleus sp.]|jgi:hypothetical protein|nr:DUF6114 domain-containing protein [Methanoculleus sp.]
MAEQGTPAVAFALSLVAGILILISGIVILMLGTAFMSGMMGGYYPGMMGEYHEGMMGGYGSPMDGYRYPTGYFPFVAAGIGIWGIVCGIIILIGSYMLYSRPASHAAWGVVILIFSLLSVFEGGGFVIGLILGVIGGILAIVLKPPYPEGGAKESA